MKTSLFLAPEMTTTEINLVAEALNTPTMIKYLTILGHQSIKAIAEGSPEDGESAESYLRRLAVVQGSLAAVQQLLAIEPPATAA
jgi:hypothetical protein